MRSRWTLVGLVALNVTAFHAPGIWLFFFLLFPVQGTGGAGDALFNTFLVLGWAGVHSLLARPFVQAFLGKLVGRSYVKLVFTVVAGITQCLMLGLWRPLEGVVWQAHGVLYGLLTLLYTATFSAVFACSLLLDYLEVLGVRGLIRRFRNEPDPPAVLCLRGPYLHCRHPVYLATFLALWVGPVMTLGRLQFALLVSVYLIVGTWLEEQDTRRTLGPAYERYRAHVPMWIPRLRPWAPRTNEASQDT